MTHSPHPVPAQLSRHHTALSWRPHGPELAILAPVPAFNLHTSLWSAHK